MPVKVLNFQNSVQCRILKTMGFSDIFMMSLCSKNMFRFIKKSIRNVSKIRFKIDEEEFKVFVETTNGKRFGIISITTIPRFIEEANPVYFRIGGMEVDHCMERMQDYNNIVFLEEFRNQMEKAVVNHATTMFQGPPGIEIQIDLAKNFDSMPKFEKIESSYLKGNPVTADVIESFFTMYPNQKSTRLLLGIDGQLADNSKIFDIPNICWSGADLRSSNALKCFNGRHVTFEDSHCDDSTIIDFFTKWTTNQGYQNLKSVNITYMYYSDIFNATELLERFHPKAWDQQRRPQTFEYEQNNGAPSYDVDCSEWLDIEREGDKKLASVDIGINWFSFYVWD